MTIKEEKRITRGFLKNGVESKFDTISFEKKITLLKSNIPTERSLGARLLKTIKTQETVEVLIEALKLEQKLYSKIEICNALTQLDYLSITPLINCLGKIGENQHKTIPKKPFLKDSYPLPRDIASRTLCQIGKKAIPELLIALPKIDTKALSELIDAIGHIHFNNPTTNIYKHLKTSYESNKTNDLLNWKIIRAYSGIPESNGFLKNELQKTENISLKTEIERSLRLIKKG